MESLSAPKVFISFSRDMAEELDACRKVVEQLGSGLSSSIRPECYCWKFADKPWTGEETWQDQIPRTSDPDVKAVICLLGERIGEPLPDNFIVPEGIALPDWVQHPWPEEGAEGKVPLTGTLLELFDAISAKKTAAGSGRLLVYIKANTKLFFEPGLEPDERCYGMEHHYDALSAGKRLKGAARAEYDQQIEWFDILAQQQFRSNKTPCVLFGNESSESSLAQFKALLEKDLAGLFGIHKQEVRSNPKGLEAYQAEDWEMLFGRDQEIRSMLDLLSAAAHNASLPILLLTGQSGQGKSSVLRAGLVGRLLNKYYSGFEGIAPVLFDCSLLESTPCDLELARTIAQQTELDIPAGSPPLEAISQEERPQEFLRRVRGLLSGGKRLLIAVDQAESLLYLSESSNTAGLLDTLGALAASGLAWVVMTAPNEHTAALEELFASRQAASLLQFRLGHPDRLAIKQIVEKTFRRSWLTLKEETAQSLANQAEDWLADHKSPGAVLPMLSVLLSNVVHSLRSNSCIEAPMPLLPHVLNSLGEHAWKKAASGGLNSDQLESKFKRLLQHLVTTVQAEQGSTPHLINCKKEHPAVKDAGELVSAMCGVRILYSPSPEEYRLTHLVLLEHWERAQKWYEEDRVHHETLDQVRRDARAWKEAPESLQKSLLETRPFYIDRMENLWITRKEDTAELPLDYLRACLGNFYDPVRAPDSAFDLKGENRLAKAFQTGDPELVAAYRTKIDGMDAAARSDLATRVSPEKQSGPIHSAACFGDTDAINWLAGLGADLAQATAEGYAPLHFAAFYSNGDNVRLLLESGQPADMPGPDGWTPLLMSAEKGNEEICRLLLDHGADPLRQNTNGHNLLHLASSWGRLPLVALFLERIAGPEQAAPFLNDSFGFAAWEGHVPVLRHLWEYAVQHGIELDKDGAILSACEAERVEAVRLLLDLGADPLAEDDAGDSPWTLAIKKGNAAIIQLLLRHTAEDGLPEDLAGRLLHLAVKHSHTPVAEVLLQQLSRWQGKEAQQEQAEQLNTFDNAGKTLLMLALNAGATDMLDLLLRYGANPNISGPYQDPPLRQAVEKCNEPGVRLLLAAGAEANHADREGESPLHVACKHDKPAIVSALLEASASLEQADVTGFTPAARAADNGCLNVLTTILNSGKKPEELASTDMSLLFAGATHQEITNLLLTHKANPNQKLANGSSPLIRATLQGDTTCIKHLLAAGAEINGKDARGMTPLMYAVWWGDVEAVKLLLANGADPSIPGPGGLQLLSFAKQGNGRDSQGRQQVLSLLQERMPH